MKINSRSALFTIVSNNYLHYAKTLFDSAAAQMPDLELYLLVVDSDPRIATEFLPNVHILALSDLELPNQQCFLFRYTILELNTAVKPWAFAWLFAKGLHNVIYLDPDIYIYQPLTEVLTALETQHIVLTPHLLAPLEDKKSPSELDIRRVGTYNLGFVAIANSTVGTKLLEWWQEKLELTCVVALEDGIFVDQSWMDLAPALFDGVVILRHLGYNVAYWNILQRPINQHKSQWMVGQNTPLVFFHFSGFNAFGFEQFSKHQDRVRLADVPQLRPLFVAYSQALIQNGAKRFSGLEYGYSHFASGEQIPDFLRTLYRNNPQLQKLFGAAPFASPEPMYRLVGSLTRERVSVTYAMWALWLVRQDLQKVWALENAQSMLGFYAWFVAEGGTYFSQATLDQHAKIAARFGGQVQLPAPSVFDLRQSRVAMLYHTILKREADANGTRVYSRILATPFGFSRTVLALWLSRESRSLPNFWRRGRLAFGVLRQAPTPQPVLEQPVRPFLDTGIHPEDSPDNVNGIWVKPVVSLPIIGAGVCRISGIYHQPHLGSEQRIQVLVNGEPQHEMVFDGSRQFEIKFPLNCMFSGMGQLQLLASQKFVPKEVGMSSDEREVSWRLQRLVLDDLVLVDSSRQPVVLPTHDYAQPSGINLVGYLAAELGVGEAARLLAKACAAQKIDYGIVDVGYQSPNLQRDRSAWADAKEKQFELDLLYVNADQTKPTQDFLLEQGYPVRPKIAFWHWEQPQLPKRFLSAFAGLTEVWVASEFVHQAVSSISPIPVFKVAHAIEFEVSRDTSRAKFGLPKNRFLVLVMFDFDSVGYRKNPQAALEVFWRVAQKHKHLTLVVKTINANRHLEAYTQLKQEFANLNVVWIDRYLSRQEVFDLESCCDTMLSLHRAEGYGLGLAEMMYLGKPVVATGWSGNMEFMTPMNSMPVQYELKPLEQELHPYELGQPWAEADLEHAAWCLAQLVSDPGLYSKMGDRAQADMRQFYSPRAIGQQIKQRLLLLERSFGS